MNGNVYTHQLDDWSISWESKNLYRHWCHQIRNKDWGNILVVMFNPGSLSGNGENLKKDTTLRILREVCGQAKLNPFIINLFDYASPSPDDLFENWNEKDAETLIFDKLKNVNFKAYITAYGDYENWGLKDNEIKDRALLIHSTFSNIQEIILPKNKSGSPKHPMIWQRQKLKPVIIKLLSEENQDT